MHSAPSPSPSPPSQQGRRGKGKGARAGAQGAPGVPPSVLGWLTPKDPSYRSFLQHTCRLAGAAREVARTHATAPVPGTDPRPLLL